MTISISQQLIAFFYCMLCGVLIAVTFDIFRIIRRLFASGEVRTFIEDLLYWLIASVIVFAFILKFNAGEIRWYMLVGVFLGGYMYLVTVSSLIIRCIVWIISFFKKLLGTILKILLMPVKWIFRFIKKPFVFIFSFSLRGVNNLKAKIHFNFSKFRKIVKKI